MIPTMQKKLTYCLAVMRTIKSPDLASTMKLAAAVISAAISLGAAASAQPFTGRFNGTGRACYGTLAVHVKTISWLTSFSQCQALPVELIERDENGGTLRLTYQFTRGASSCRFGVVSLMHNNSSDMDTGWQVVGYGTKSSFLADKSDGYTRNAPDMMSCYLIRDRAKQVRNEP